MPVGFAAGTDACLSIYRDVFQTGALVFPPDASVLEIGCAEANWMAPMLVVRPDLRLTGIDWRQCENPQGTIVRGDVLVHDFPAAAFDVVVGISSIEHIGLGHYQDDPLDVDGDRRCMERVVRWLKPGGWVYLDVPYDESGYYVSGTACRVYDQAALHARLIVPGLTLAGTWYADQHGVLSDQPAGQNGYTAVLATRTTL